MWTGPSFQAYWNSRTNSRGVISSSRPLFSVSQSKNRYFLATYFTAILEKFIYRHLPVLSPAHRRKDLSTVDLFPANRSLVLAHKHLYTLLRQVGSPFPEPRGIKP